MNVDLVADLERRGLLHASTDRSALVAHLGDGPVTLYYGCDPTADSLHVGNLVGLLILRRFQLAGHRPIALAGGATGMIGDPSGRSEERNLLGREELASNVAAISEQIARILGAAGERAWELVDNATWTAELSLLDFLRDVGKHVTVNQMVARESVRARMQSEQGISFTEFSYMLLQANDYLWLHDQRRCTLQIGGSDQWGNIVSGIDLIRRRRGSTVHGLCWPLLTGPDGAKLGKSTGGRVWLDSTRTSPYQLYQHFMAVPDHDVARHLAWFTLLPMDEVDAVVGAHLSDPSARRAQRRLAGEVTSLVHGQRAAASAAEAAAVLFGERDPRSAGVEALAAVAAEVPGAATLGLRDTTVVSALVATELARSNGEARRHLDQGAVRLNGEPVRGDRHLTAEDLLHGRWVVLRRGKRSFAVLDARPG